MNEYKLDFGGQHKVKHILIFFKVPLENFWEIFIDAVSGQPFNRCPFRLRRSQRRRGNVMQPLEFSETYSVCLLIHCFEEA